MKEEEEEMWYKYALQTLQLLFKEHWQNIPSKVHSRTPTLTKIQCKFFTICRENIGTLWVRFTCQAQNTDTHALSEHGMPKKVYPPHPV